MLFLVELDHVKTGPAPTPEAGRAFIEQVIFPTLDRAERLAAERTMVAGGAVAGRIALRFMIEADSVEQIDGIVSSLPIWPLAETRIRPLVTFAERRGHLQTVLAGLAGSRPSEQP